VPFEQAAKQAALYLRSHFPLLYTDEAVEVIVEHTLRAALREDG